MLARGNPSTWVVVAGVLALGVIAALTFPLSASAAIASYSGQTSAQDFTNDGVNNGTPQPFGFDFDGTSINNVHTSTSLRCPDGSYMNMGTLPSLPGEPFPVTNGHFDATVGDPNQGHGLTWHLVGNIVNGRASGTAEVQAHEYSSVTPTGPICTSSFTWTASASSSPPTSPTPAPTSPEPPSVTLTPSAPERSRPAASLMVVGLRSGDTRYFWGTSRVRCLNGATNLVFTVRRNRRLISRKRIGCRRKISLASSEVAHHRTYAIRVQAVRMRRRRIVERGEAYRVRLYMPGNEARWVPVPGLGLP